jgi:zinc ribbon protein
MHCSYCGLPMASEDNFCRKCGAAVDVIDVPAVRGEAVPARFWREARPALARGVALVAAGAVLRIVVGQAARLALGRSLVAGDRSRRLFPFSAGEGAEEIEILWYRRVRH